MNIIIVGGGKVGATLTEVLSQEGHAITLIDINQARLESAVSNYDIQAVLGSGCRYDILKEAGIDEADLLIAVTGQDEQNMLTCLLGRKAGNCQTIARVRDPYYYEDLNYIQQELGLSLSINPERAAASAIAQLIQIPSALDVDSFNKGKVNMIRFPIREDSPINGKTVREANDFLNGRVLICIRERSGELVIPHGETDLKAGDNISVMVTMPDVADILVRLKLQSKPIKTALIAGGGGTAMYLANMLHRAKIETKIIELNPARCEVLADLVPFAKIICGSATDKQLLTSEGLYETGAFIALTGIDEENIMLALYAQKTSSAKVITKLSRNDFEEVVADLPLGSVVYHKTITAEIIVRYVRAMQNASHSNMETLYRLFDGRVEALEFIADAKIRGVTDIPLRTLKLKDNLLLSSINRKGRIFRPTGSDTIQPGDIVVIVTTHKGIRDLTEILQTP